MNNSESFVISTNSKTYKTMHWFSEFFLTCWIVSSDHRDELTCFRNLCAFLRTSTILAVYLLTLLIGLIYVFATISMPFSEMLSPATNNPFIVFAAFFKYIFVGVFLVFLVVTLICSFIYKSYSKISELVGDKDLDEKPIKKKEPNLFLQSLKDRHNKICRSFTIEK